jgi:hypothetical protein
MMKASGPTTVHIRIGRVTLHGFGPGDRVRFAGALQAGIARFAERSAPRDWTAAGTSIRRVDAGRLSSGATIEDAADRVAGRLFAELERRKGPRDA